MFRKSRFVMFLKFQELETVDIAEVCTLKECVVH
jgi:hypothetical protein